MKKIITLICILISSLSIINASSQKIPKGSKLTSQVFDLARPTIEQQAGQALKFAGSQTRLRQSAFFIGQIVNAKGGAIYVYDSPETLLLWKQANGTWTFITGEAVASNYWSAGEIRRTQGTF